MERDTARRAADMLTDLLSAHVSDSAEEIDVYEAMAVRDDLRQIQRKPSEEYDLPAVGDEVIDPDSNPRFGSGKVRVTGVYPDSPASEWEICPDDDRIPYTVAQKNPGCDEDAPVIEAVYVDGSDKVYAFPVDRLEQE